MMSKKIVFALISLVMVLALVLGACQQQAPAEEAGTTESEIDANAPVEIWIDAAREESAAKYLDQNAEKADLISLTTTDYGQLPQKILFWNNVGGGWPDASFSGPNIVPLINDAAHSYLGDIRPYVSQEIIDGFAEGSLQNCWDGEKLYCLRNDLAHFVTWYNAPLVEELGIKVPETYEELEATCKQVKETNPEIQCALGQESVSAFNMLVSNQCPFQQILGPGKIRVNALHENCLKPMQYLDKATSEGWYLLTNMFSTEASDIVKSDKWLFMPSSSWFGDYVIRGTYYDPADPNFVGKIGVAPAQKWEGQEHPWVWWWGGAAWVLSRHSKNPELVVDFLKFMTTDEIKNQGTYPAYVPAADEWLKERMPTLTYLNDSAAAGDILKQESTHMWTMAAESPVDVNTLWAVLQTKINAGELTYEAALAEFQTAMLDQASKLGYEAVTDGFDDFPEE
jgi:ABC-type glycerol-3-phosphate transport system substrate-binding protein